MTFFKNLHDWQPTRGVVLFILFSVLSGRPLPVLAEIPVLKKSGQATAYWAGLIPVYDAQLWVSDITTYPNLLSDQTPLRLELCYHVALSKENFIKAAKKGLPNPLSPSHIEAVNQLHLAYENVTAGDCYQLSYDAMNGTQLRLNNQLKFQTKTPGFKTLYFGLWLGQHPLSDTVKTTLLKGLLK